MSAPTLPASDVRVAVAPVRPPRRLLGRIVGWLMLLVLLSAVALPALVVWKVYSAAGANERKATDAIVVLGAAQYNGKPSPVFSERLRHAIGLYHDSIAPTIVTVGGKQPADRFTEAEAGAEFLAAKGVPTSDVVAVPRGNDTLQSLEAVARKARKEGWHSVTLVSDPAHMARAEAIADRLGFDVQLNPTRTGDGTAMTGRYVLRETLGLSLFETVQRWSTPVVVR